MSVSLWDRAQAEEPRACATCRWYEDGGCFNPDFGCPDCGVRTAVGWLLVGERDVPADNWCKAWEAKP